MITREGCASILWKEANYAAQAAEAMGVTTAQIAKLGIIDAILPEPLGGAHRDPEKMAKTIGEFLEAQLKTLQSIPIDQLLKQRYDKLLKGGY